MLALYMHKFPENGAASLTDLSELFLALPELCLGLPEFRLQLSDGSGSTNACQF